MTQIDYKYVAMDVNDYSFYKEFTDLIKMKAWMAVQEDHGRMMDWVAKSQFNWLKKQDDFKKQQKKHQKKKISHEFESNTIKN